MPRQRDGEAGERYPDVTSHQIQSCPDEFCSGVMLEAAPKLSSLNRRVPEVYLARSARPAVGTETGLDRGRATTRYIYRLGTAISDSLG